MCDRLSITPFRTKPTHFLSGGQKKRVSIADILVMGPQLLILDEPFSALDPKHARMIDDILEQLAQEGITVVIATHNTDHAYRWADRVVLLNNAHILAQGSPEQIFSDHELLSQANLETPQMLRVRDVLANQGMLPSDCFPKTPEQLAELLARKR